MPQRRDLGIQPVDPALEPRDAAVVDHDLLDPLGDPVRRVGQPRAEREQIALQREAHLVEIRRQAGGADHAEARLHFVDVAVGHHARMRLADARAVEQAGVAGIAGLCVDGHGRIIGGQVPGCTTSLSHHLATLDGHIRSLHPPLRQRFRRNLLAWYRTNGRDLPWRNTGDPYHILVSEIMLQQTQVDRVLPKYHEWLGKYPSFAVLAEAKPAEVDQDLVPARLQHPAAPPAVDRAAGGREVRRPPAVGPRHADVVQGHRRVHRRRDPQLRLPRARRDSRHQRRARPVPDLHRQGRSEDPRDEEAAVGAIGGGAAAQARLRLQPGPDGLRRHALQRAQAEVPGVPDARILQDRDRPGTPERVPYATAIRHP